MGGSIRYKCMMCRRIVVVPRMLVRGEKKKKRTYSFHGIAQALFATWAYPYRFIGLLIFILSEVDSNKVL